MYDAVFERFMKTCVFIPAQRVRGNRTEIAERQIIESTFVQNENIRSR